MHTAKILIDVTVKSKAYLVTGPLFSVFLTRIFSLETTRFSVVEAVRSCMMGPMLHPTRCSSEASVES